MKKHKFLKFLNSISGWLTMILGLVFISLIIFFIVTLFYFFPLKRQDPAFNTRMLLGYNISEFYLKLWWIFLFIPISSYLMKIFGIISKYCSAYVNIFNFENEEKKVQKHIVHMIKLYKKKSNIVIFSILDIFYKFIKTYEKNYYKFSQEVILVMKEFIEHKNEKEYKEKEFYFINPPQKINYTKIPNKITTISSIIFKWGLILSIFLIIISIGVFLYSKQAELVILKLFIVLIDLILIFVFSINVGIYSYISSYNDFFAEIGEENDENDIKSIMEIKNMSFKTLTSYLNQKKSKISFFTKFYNKYNFRKEIEKNWFLLTEEQKEKINFLDLTAKTD